MGLMLFVLALVVAGLGFAVLVLLVWCRELREDINILRRQLGIGDGKRIG